MRSSKNNKALPIIATVLVTLAIIGGSFYTGVSYGKKQIPDVEKIYGLKNKEGEKPARVDFAPFWKVWSIINERFVEHDGTTDQDKVWGSVAGLAASLKDPYTVFFSPEELKSFKEGLSGNFGGVGMEVGMREGVLTVIAPLKGTPAEIAGILSGDKIIQINGTSTANLSLDKAVGMIRGEPDTEVTLTIIREGLSEPLELKIIRAIIQIPTIETRITEGKIEIEEGGAGVLHSGVYIIELFNFTGNVTQQFRDALRGFITSKSDKLVLDLRDNPGGFLEAAVDIASWFLPTGESVVIEEVASGKEGKVHRSRGYNVFNKNLKMAILVNGGSASASEIVAGALREHGIAKLIGEKTFGKGSVQELIDVTENTAIKVTTARWLTPNGHSISKEGLEPDIVVKMTREDVKNKKDPQLDKAIEYLNSL